MNSQREQLVRNDFIQAVSAMSNGKISLESARKLADTKLPIEDFSLGAL